MSYANTDNTVTNLESVVSELTKNGNWAAALFGTPGGIEASERGGQREMEDNPVLPIENSDKALCESWGIKFKGPVAGDPLFEAVELPAGWKKRRHADHAMWSDLVDDKGHARAAIFYKASFHDRKAHMTANRRLFATLEYKTESDFYGRVETSDGVEVWKTETARWDAALLPPVGGEREFYQRKHALCDDLRQQARKWLDETYPDNQSTAAYWDLDVENGERPKVAAPAPSVPSPKIRWERRLWYSTFSRMWNWSMDGYINGQLEIVGGGELPTRPQARFYARRCKERSEALLKEQK